MVQMIHFIVLMSLIKMMLSAHKCKIVMKCADPLSVDGNCLERMPRDEIYFYNYTRCAEGKICAKNEITEDDVVVKCIDKVKKKNLYDGQECGEHSQCHSKNCTNGICLGKKKGASCASTDECATRHYCKQKTKPDPPEPEPEPDPPEPEPDPPEPDPPEPEPDPPEPEPDPPGPGPFPPGPFISDPLIPSFPPEQRALQSKTTNEFGVCVPQEKAGAECTTEFDCRNNALCGPGNQCVDYFSFENGEAAENELLCKSGKIGNKIDSNKQVCVSYKRVETEGECAAEQTTCTFKATENEEGKVEDKTEECQCSYSSADKQYCSLDPSGKEFTDYLDILREYYRVEAHDYHTKLRHTSVDPQLRRKLFFYKTYPKYVNADDCAFEFGMSSSFISSYYLRLLAILISLLI